MSESDDNGSEAVSERTDSNVGRAREKFQQVSEQLGERVRGVSEGARKASSQLRENAGRARETARERYGETVDQLREGYGRVRKDMGSLSEDCEDFVRDNPGKAVAIAAAVGFLAGLILRRRGD